LSGEALRGRALDSELCAKALIPGRDLVWVVLDTLRYDVARDLLAAGRTPFLEALLPQAWEERHTPGNFTYAAHQAFFAGFLPTPVGPGPHPRLFAARFPGSETTSDTTSVFDAPDLVSGLASQGYRTICIGGVGFFNKLSPLGCVLPGLFSESHWSQELGVTARDSTRAQVSLATELLSQSAREERVFLFMNVSALHQPNRHYLPGASEDSLESHGAALEYVDAQLEPLFRALAARGGALCVVCADHGTAYGEDGHYGHRLNHPVVTTVPYAEFFLDPQRG
jgi:sulfatase-like protein